MTEEFVALGDSSFARYPSGSRRYHWPHPEERAVSACGRTIIGDPDIAGSNAISPEHADPVLRCGSNGCHQRWDRWLAAHT